jgi:hypothetical protein
MADQADRHEPAQVHQLSCHPNVRECDSVFCANTGCALHVRPGDINVQGNGNWAKTADGVMTGRQRVENLMLCDRCVARMLRRELIMHLLTPPNAPRS